MSVSTTLCTGCLVGFEDDNATGKSGLVFFLKQPVDWKRQFFSNAYLDINKKKKNDQNVRSTTL